LFIAHANALKDDLTVAESLQFLARLHGQGASADSIGDALKTVGLASRRRAPIRTLSQGQKRRVALARLMLEPAKPLWILDEPFDALDVDGLAMACGVLVAHAARGGAAVLTSHVPFALECGALRELDLEACAA
jgi:heme exporter protein A